MSAGSIHRRSALAITANASIAFARMAGAEGGPDRPLTRIIGGTAGYGRKANPSAAWGLQAWSGSAEGHITAGYEGAGMSAVDAIVAEGGRDFIRDIVAEDLESGRHKTVVTRFPPEPNGYLHIGHAKSICLNFGIAEEFGGRCHLRFDDTNPTKEEQEYIDAIERDVRWLGFDWGKHLYHASDYFEQLYQWAEHLIRAGKAYVDDQSQEEMRAARGTLTEPGRPSPYRDRSVEENLDLFRRMRAGEFPDGTCVLRAKIDLAARNMKMRDPLLYRIRHAYHHRAGDAWCIYPMYDWAHPLEEAIRAFADLIGVAKVNSVVDIGKLEFCVRDDLNWIAPRVLGVLRPLRVTVTSWPEGEVEQLTGPYFPPDVGKPGERTLPFTRELFIDRDDFALDPPAGYQRLAPGRPVRLRHGYC